MTALDQSTRDALTRARYVSLTTYRKDGTPVATPVWHVVDEGRLYVWTEADTFKVKRLRRDPRAKVVVCDVRGRIAPGAAEAEGTGRVLDAEGTEEVRLLLGRKYLLARIGHVFATLTGRRRRRPIVGLEISF
ncbi:PPOX class F420-dependent oxidoreductase [Streptacidiphilus sp. P02-A3a]|uniref:PPOX class F420-dependent oxidoreductase n=1 Tax=Streptacidiphilus sp. P02-A3a TaxID=2704468 RepID=UPI0015FE0536|nr:PPOX class F420-dependent oxidoreductase [Streptacidiphilus sp. P02-A3a]QMU71685.1 PPOX class F420-dependent oxidoreductase [Streptacidiphilus sp. P02-A3a]